MMWHLGHHRLVNQPIMFSPSDYGERSALSNLQSLHTLECQGDWRNFRRHLACIPMKNLRIVKSGDREVIKSLLTSGHPTHLSNSRSYASYVLHTMIITPPVYTSYGTLPESGQRHIGTVRPE